MSGTSPGMPQPSNPPYAGVLACSVWGLLTVWPQAASPDTWLGKKPVGHSISLQQLVLPGPELETKPSSEAGAPLVLRIDGVWPHGSDHRYDVSVLGLEAGEFDLRPYLRLKGGGTHDLPTPLQVRFESTLPEGAFEPTALKPLEVPMRYGYGDLLKALTVLWVLGLIGLWIWVRGGKARHLQQETQAAPPSLIEQLQPLIERAASGHLNNREKARLEKMILGYWAQRLHLQKTSANEQLATLLKHPQAGPSIRTLEQWLHSPGSLEAPLVGPWLETFRSQGDASSLPPA